MPAEIEFAARCCRALPTGRAGYEEERFRLPAARTALVGMHCWNIGCPDGPAETGELVEALERSAS